MKKIGFQLKLSLFLVVLSAAILASTTFFIYQRAVIQQKENLRARILGLAKLASLLIDADTHSRIIPQMESQATADYKQIQKVLRRIKDADPLIDSVYTMIKTDKNNIWMFVVDSGDKTRRIAYCGELYDVSSMPQMQEAFEAPSVDNALTRDKWGLWLSGYAPIYDNNAKAVAIVGLDISAQSINQMQLILAKRFLIVLILGIILSLLISWLVARGITRPLRYLVGGAREIAKGNLQQKINIKSSDEIQELAEAFNKMTDGLVSAQDKLQHHYLDTVKSLAMALEAKDHYTKGHSERVARFAGGIARQLKMSAKEIKLLEDISILHDIGKIGISEKILTKPASLSDEEYWAIKEHPKIGEDILKPIEFLKPGLSIISSHHERIDGKGYPHGLSRDKIPFLASIVSVADAFDAMTSDRPYRKALSKEKAIAILKENIGSQFERSIVEAFITSVS